MPPKRKRAAKPVAKPIATPATKYASEPEDVSQAELDELEEEAEVSPPPAKKTKAANAKSTKPTAAASKQKTAESAQPAAARAKTTKGSKAVETRRQKSNKVIQPPIDSELEDEDLDEEPENDSEEDLETELEADESVEDIPEQKKAASKGKKSTQPKKIATAASKVTKTVQQPQNTLRGMVIANNVPQAQAGRKRKVSNEEQNTAVTTRKRSKNNPNSDETGLASFYGPIDNLPMPDENIKIPPLSKFKKSFKEKTVADRVEELDRRFKNGEIAKEQIENYRAVVKAYRDGTMPDCGAVFAGGIRTTLQEAKFEMGCLWAESRYHLQLLNVPAVASPKNSIATYPWDRQRKCHDVYLAVRLCPDYGGNPHRIKYMTYIYDTGSSTLTISEDDITWFEQGLAPWPNGDYGYFGYLTEDWYNTLGGSMVRQTILVEIALLDSPGAHGSFISPWLRETGCIVPRGMAYVTGLAIRRPHYIGNGPLDGAGYLVVSEHRAPFVNAIP